MLAGLVDRGVIRDRGGGFVLFPTTFVIGYASGLWRGEGGERRVVSVKQNMCHAVG